MSASASKDRRPGASAPGVRSFRWTRETRMSSGPRRCVGGCRELRRRPPERLGRCAKGRRSTRRRGAAPTAPLGPRGASAGCGDGPAAGGGTPRCGRPRPPDHRAAAAGPAARPPLGRHLPRLLAVARPGARGGPGPAEPVRRLARPPSLAVALVLHRGALSRPGQPWWWRPTRRTAAWEAGSLVWLTAAGALISLAPAPAALVAAAVAGALNARAVEAIAASAGEVRAGEVRARRRRVRKAVTPVAVAAIFATVVGGTGIGFATIRQGVPDLRRASIPYRAVGHPVLVASGFNSRWGPPPALEVPHGFVTWRYSYRGLTPAGELLPYTPTDTQQSLLVSATTLESEVDALHRAYGQPVTLVAESEGALVARTYLLRRYRPQTRAVDRVVLLDMPQGQPHVSFPRPGQTGWGVGTGWALRGLISLIGNLGPLTASADAPFSRDLISRPRLLAALALAPPPPGVQQVWVEALADAVTQPYPQTRTLRGPSSPTIVVPAPHGGLVHNPAVQRIIAGVLAGTALPDPQPAAALQPVLAAAASAWQV